MLRNAVYDTWEEAGRPPPGKRPGEGETVATGPAGAIVRYAMVPAIVGIDGDIEAMSLYAGLGAGSITSIEPAGEIIERFAAALA